MGRIFLTSTGLFYPNVRQCFQELIAGRKSAVIIPTASALKELNPFAIQARVDMLELGFEEVAFLDVEKEPIDRLQVADVIYLSGGNPFVLLHFLKESGAVDLLRLKAEEDCLFVGVSAGAVVLGLSILIVEWFSPSMNTVRLEDMTGCGLFDFTVFPHADREDLFPALESIEDRVFAFEIESGEHVLRLEDDQCHIVRV